MPQQLSNKYEQRYDELLRCIGAGAKSSGEAMTAFWPMCGHRYDGKLMIVGRAPNGWEGEFRTTALRDQGERAKVMRFARDVAENGVPEWRQPGRCPMLWVTDQWVDRRGGGYTTSKSRLWLLGRELSLSMRLHGGASTEEWPSAICWSDLYKVAPKGGGNPSTSFKSVQLEAAASLLAREVDEFNPRLVVVLAGHDWYAPFVERIGLKPRPVDGPAVEAVASGDRLWLLAKPPTYMGPGVTVDDYQNDIATWAARVA